MLEAVVAHLERGAEEVSAVSAGTGAGDGRGEAAASGTPPAPAGSGGAAYHYDVFISYAHKDGKDAAALLDEGLTRGASACGGTKPACLRAT